LVVEKNTHTGASITFPPKKYTPDEHLFPNMECRLWVAVDSSYWQLPDLKFRFTPQSGYAPSVNFNAANSGTDATCILAMVPALCGSIRPETGVRSGTRPTLAIDRESLAGNR